MRPTRDVRQRRGAKAVVILTALATAAVGVASCGNSPTSPPPMTVHGVVSYDVLGVVLPHGCASLGRLRVNIMDASQTVLRVATTTTPALVRQAPDPICHANYTAVIPKKSVYTLKVDGLRITTTSINGSEIHNDRMPTITVID